MHFIWRRYARSGYAPPWYYALFAAGFVALAGWAVATGDWLIAAIAVVMALVAVAATRFTPRLRTAREESEHLLDDRSNEARHG